MEPYWQINGSVRQFDRSIANPPFSQTLYEERQDDARTVSFDGWRLRNRQKKPT